MDDQFSKAKRVRRPLPQPNPLTRRQHRKQVRWQVYVPLLFGGLTLAGTIYALCAFGVGSLSQWATIASIAVGILVVALLSLILVVLAGITYGLWRILDVLPPYSRLAQDAVASLNEQVHRGANLSIKPIITIKSYLAMLESIFGHRNGRNS